MYVHCDFFLRTLFELALVLMKAKASAPPDIVKGPVPCIKYSKKLAGLESTRDSGRVTLSLTRNAKAPMVT